MSHKDPCSCDFQMIVYPLPFQFACVTLCWRRPAAQGVCQVAVKQTSRPEIIIQRWETDSLFVITSLLFMMTLFRSPPHWWPDTASRAVQVTHPPSISEHSHPELPDPDLRWKGETNNVTICLFVVFKVFGSDRSPRCQDVVRPSVRPWYYAKEHRKGVLDVF